MLFGQPTKSEDFVILDKSTRVSFLVQWQCDPQMFALRQG